MEKLPVVEKTLPPKFSTTRRVFCISMKKFAHGHLPQKAFAPIYGDNSPIRQLPQKIFAQKPNLKEILQLTQACKLATFSSWPTYEYAEKLSFFS